MSTKSNVGPTRKHPAASLGPTRKRPAASGGSRATGVLELSSSSTGALEIDLGQLYDAAVKNATRKDEEFLQKVHALGHYPRESRSSSKEEQLLAMQARDRQRSNTCSAPIRLYLAALRLSQLHPEVEGAWESLKGKYWRVQEEMKFGYNFEQAFKEHALSQEAFQLLRDLESVLRPLDRSTLEPLCRCLGYSARWKLNMQNKRCDADILLHFCRSHVCDMVNHHMQKFVHTASDSNDAACAEAARTEHTFRTPKNLTEFAASLQHSEHRFTTPFARDFMSTAYQGQLSRRELLHHVMVLE